MSTSNEWREPRTLCTATGQSVAFQCWAYDLKILEIVPYLSSVHPKSLDMATLEHLASEFLGFRVLLKDMASPSGRNLFSWRRA